MPLTMGRLLFCRTNFPFIVLVVLTLCALASGMMLGRTGMPPDAAQGVLTTFAATANGVIGEGMQVMVRRGSSARS